MIDAAHLAALRAVDTPTICNAIELIEGKRGFDAFTRGTLLASDPAAPPLVGYALTAQIAAVEPPAESPEVIKARRLDYYRHMAEGPRPGIAVIEDLDGPHAVGAFWGELNTTVHKGLGVSGTLTNGVMRDLGDLAPGYPVLAGSVGPSHAFVHVRSVAQPVTVFGLRVNDGDLIHADRHGACVIPPGYVAELPAAIARMQEIEALVIEPARQPGFDFGKFEAAWAAVEKARV
jgi:regulator of RNase E activity RraA